MVSHPRLRGLISLAAAALVALVCVSPAGATHRGPDVVDEVFLNVSYRAATVAGVHDRLVAQLTVDDGSPVVAVEVTFWREVYFVGVRRILVGRAQTDVSGTASVPISAPNGPLRVVAGFAGDEHYLPGNAVEDVTVPPGSEPANSNAGVGQQSDATLALFATFMPLLLALTAFSVWLLIFGLTAKTVLAIRRGRPASVAKGD